MCEDEDLVEGFRGMLCMRECTRGVWKGLLITLWKKLEENVRKWKINFNFASHIT